MPVMPMRPPSTPSKLLRKELQTDDGSDRVIGPLLFDGLLPVGKPHVGGAVFADARRMIAVGHAGVFRGHIAVRIHGDRRIAAFYPKGYPLVKRRTPAAVHQHDSGDGIFRGSSFRKADEGKYLRALHRIDKISLHVQRLAVERVVALRRRRLPERCGEFHFPARIQLTVRLPLRFFRKNLIVHRIFPISARRGRKDEQRGE